MLILLVSILILFFAFILKVYRLLILDDVLEKESYIKASASTAGGYFIYKEMVAYKWIKKINAKTPFSIICIVLFLVFNISANVSIWPNVKGMSVEDKSNSIVFRSMRGSNCINEFNALKNVLKIAVESGYRNDDIVRIFGEPNSIVNGNQYCYNLFPETNGCVAIIEFENDRMISYHTKNCN